jgi:hypothetical protein
MIKNEGIKDFRLDILQKGGTVPLSVPIDSQMKTDFTNQNMV